MIAKYFLTHIQDTPGTSYTIINGRLLPFTIQFSTIDDLAQAAQCINLLRILVTSLWLMVP